MSCLRPLTDDAENVKPHFVVSREYVTVQRLKGLNALWSAIFSVECLIPQTD